MRRLLLPLLLLAAFLPAAADTEPPRKSSPFPDCPICTNADGTIIENCLIKGNINKKGDHIYHCPLWRDYDKTVIDIENGERWFCTELEALAAGWRKPKYNTGPCRWP